ncbi:MFS general substrate transporter [Cladophialophora carrionii]|uniref:MFS general substrate transporter n=1 Tax=Cladophialophora carrionii TaxID=86049 RepID=A0A1C1CL34_9EURO|nr:MFS general substrate transporter [Cladophialophora carrionii]
MSEKSASDRDAENVEKAVEDGQDTLDSSKYGGPLDARNSEDKNDPLYWPYWLKVYLAFMVSGLGFVNQLGSALINPAFVVIAEDLHISVEQASYCTTVVILFMGIMPMFVVPFSNVYGRRILYLFFTAVAAACQFGSGAATTYGGLITGRIFYGVGASIPLGLGAATICDLFPQGERGTFLGIYTLCVNNGPHLAPIIGGYIALNLSWRWCLYVPGIIQAGFFVCLCLTSPETLYSRTEGIKATNSSYLSGLLPRGKILDRPIRPRDFLQPYIMIRYWAVSLPAIYWMTANTYGSAQFAVTGSKLARQLYDFDVAQTGLLMGIPQTVGCMVGEATAGWVSDMIINAYAKRHDGYRKPEVRLALLPGCVALIAGLIAYGVCVDEHKPWPSLAITMGVASFGLQVGATMIYTYATDCYKPQAPEVGVVINLYKSIFAFTIGFYAVPFGTRHGYDVSFGVTAAINGATLLPLVWLYFCGEQVRRKQGRPRIHEDL